MKELGIFINNFGYAIRMQQGEIHPKELQKLLDKLEGTSEEPLLSRLVLRSMKQARYTTDCSGHFGLAARYYTHFTSPIRRYPDLQIHRIIKENLGAACRRNAGRIMRPCSPRRLCSPPYWSGGPRRRSGRRRS